MITANSQETRNNSHLFLKETVCHEYAFLFKGFQETSQDVLFRNPSGNMIQVNGWNSATTAYVRTMLTPTNGSYVGIQCSYIISSRIRCFMLRKN